MTDDNQHTPDQPTTSEPAEPGWRDRVLGLRGVAAVAVASLILGGAGGAALGALSNGADDDGGRPGFGPGGGPGQFQQQQLPPQDGVRPDSSS